MKDIIAAILITAVIVAVEGIRNPESGDTDK